MNVHESKQDRTEYLEKYFTVTGIEALENRLQNLATLYTEDQKYPFIARMLGFVTLEIRSRDHHEGMMDNLKQILALKEIIIKGE